jgi:hypothetical protein
LPFTSRGEGVVFFGNSAAMREIGSAASTVAQMIIRMEAF